MPCLAFSPWHTLLWKEVAMCGCLGSTGLRVETSHKYSGFDDTPLTQHLGDGGRKSSILTSRGLYGKTFKKVFSTKEISVLFFIYLIFYSLGTPGD